jgi:hypothetical protein
VAWLELELMVSSWLQFDLLGATGRYLAKLSYSLMVCNAGGRLWRRVRRLLRFFRIQRHDRSLWEFLTPSSSTCSHRRPCLRPGGSVYRSAADLPVTAPFPLLTPSLFSRNVGCGPLEVIGQRTAPLVTSGSSSRKMLHRKAKQARPRRTGACLRPCTSKSRR